MLQQPLSVFPAFGRRHLAQLPAVKDVAVSIVAVLVCIALLLWPALLNGYPLVFADTGTYLSQAIQHYVGWDRPAIYSVFLLLMHWKMTTWVAVFAQAGLTLYVLEAVRRGFAPEIPRALLLPSVALLCMVTPLPWFVDQLMPDLFTSLLALVIALLILIPQRFSRWEMSGLSLFASWMISVHLSNIWISIGLVTVLVPLRRRLGADPGFGWQGLRRVVSPILLAVLVLCTVNLAAFGRFSVSPFGNVFFLARLVYDGPARMTLESDCATSRWRLCSFLSLLPPRQTAFPTSDFFLWRTDGPVARLGGAKKIAGEAGQIIVRTIEEHPVAILESSLINLRHQLLRFRSGDGLNSWTKEVGSVIGRSFPKAEFRNFSRSRQSRGLMRVPHWLSGLHTAAFWAGLAATLFCFVVEIRRRQPLALLCATILLCLIGNAAATGMLSGPHDRYQNRIIWLAMVIPLILGFRLWSWAVRYASRRRAASMGAVPGGYSIPAPVPEMARLFLMALPTA